MKIRWTAKSRFSKGNKYHINWNFGTVFFDHSLEATYFDLVGGFFQFPERRINIIVKEKSFGRLIKNQKKMFSKTCQYGIRAVIYVCSKSRNSERVGVKEICQAIDALEFFTGKILQMLAKNKIISS